MKNFCRFEKVYGELVAAVKELDSIKSNAYFPPSAEKKAADSAKEGITAALALLREWFKDNFPRDTFDAYHSNQFSFPAFFAMLKKYPELAAENKDSLEKLLYSLRSSNLYSANLREVPSLDEFI